MKKSGKDLKKKVMKHLKEEKGEVKGILKNDKKLAKAAKKSMC